MFSTELQRITTAKSNIIAAIENKGVSVNDDVLFDELPSYINRITQNGTSEVVFEPITNTLTPSSPHKMNGYNIWTDGTDIYYSGGNNLHYQLTSETDTELVWTKITWGGLSVFSGNNVWTDGDNIYFSSNTTHYVLDKVEKTWSVQTWNGLTNFSGSAVWSDGTDIYYCAGAASTRYILDKDTHTWSSVADKWTGLANMYGYYMFTDGTDLYHAIIQLVSGGWSYTTTLHKLEGTKFTQITPNFNYASTAGFNGGTVWKYKGKIRSCDLGPIIFDPSTATLLPDTQYSSESFIGVGYMFTTTPNKDIKLSMKMGSFGNDKDVDYTTTKLYSLCNGQCYRLRHTEDVSTQLDDDEGASLQMGGGFGFGLQMGGQQSEDPTGNMTIDTNYLYDGVVYDNGLSQFQFDWVDDRMSISTMVSQELVQQIYPDAIDVDLRYYATDCQKVDMTDEDLLTYTEQWSKYVGNNGGTGSETMSDYFNSDGMNTIVYYNPTTGETRIKMVSEYGTIESKDF